MTNDLLENLRQVVKKKIPSTLVHTIKFPTGIEYPYGMNDGTGCCKIRLSNKAHSSNMQEDASAFEGWALVIKTWLGERGVKSVELSWGEPVETDECNGHYQRFLYRVIRFIQLFDWFSVSDESKNQLLKSRILAPDGLAKVNPNKFYLNSGGTRETYSYDFPKSTEEFNKMTEHEAEILFISNEKPLLESVFKSESATLKRQLPVGVFDGIPSKKKDCPIFSHGKSAIDLWATSDDRVVLFELKKPRGNKKVGAVSELFFYVNVINDLKNKLFSYEVATKEEKFHNKKIEGYLLIGENNLHPLLSEEVFNEINSGLYKIECAIGLVCYGYNEDDSLWCNREYPR